MYVLFIDYDINITQEDIFFTANYVGVISEYILGCLVGIDLFLQYFALFTSYPTYYYFNLVLVYIL